MTRRCPQCGSSEIDEDAARGDATCMECGTVLEESIVVSENQFQERSGGSGHTLVGQFISMERAQHHTLQGVPGLASQESREITFNKGRRLIEEIASQLRINQHCIDTSFNFFKMCVTKNLTRGRIRSHVVAACMYMTCRLENTAHLLLDFSDITQVNVFDLGRTLSFLSRSLFINLPTTDPCLYIMRFACLLDFADKQKEVVNLATRLVTRMKRDWMSTGRRPTGLCGAALLIAARAHNFNRTIADIVRIVHISESVVRKRLDEFSQTPSGALTIDEFSSVDLEHCEDPPAFRESRKKAREQQVLQEAELAEKMAPEVHSLEVDLEKALEKKRREKFRNTSYAKLMAGDIDGVDVGKPEERLVRNSVIDSVFEVADSDVVPSASTDFNAYRPTPESLGIGRPPTNIFASTSTNPLPAMDNPNGDLSLDDIDDDEIESYILTESESKMKEQFWTRVNGDHLKEMERRKREREEQEEKGKESTQKKKRRRSTASRPVPGSISASEAIEKVIQERRLSHKVNYDILKEIESGADIVTLKTASDSWPNAMKPSVMERDTPSSIISGSGERPEELSRREMDRSRRNAQKANESNLGSVRACLKIDDDLVVPKSESSPLFRKPTPSTRGRGRAARGMMRPNLNVKKEMTNGVVIRNSENDGESSSSEKSMVIKIQDFESKKAIPEISRNDSEEVPEAPEKTLPKPAAEQKDESAIFSRPNMLSRKKKMTIAKAAFSETKPTPEPETSTNGETPSTSEEAEKSEKLVHGLLAKKGPMLSKAMKTEQVAESNTEPPPDNSEETPLARKKPRIRPVIPEELLRRSSRNS